jgi:hypothetical protein
MRRSNREQHIGGEVVNQSQEAIRIPRLRASCAAALVALLAACAQTDPAPVTKNVAVATSTIPATSDIPEVVITASRSHSDSIG